MRRKFIVIIFIIVVSCLVLVGFLLKTNIYKTPSRDELFSENLLNKFSAPLNSFKIDVGRYPTSEEGLDALLKPANSNIGKWRGPYIQNSPTSLMDPWGGKIIYKYLGVYYNGNDSYEIISAGPDGIIGTKDDIRYEGEDRMNQPLTSQP